MFRYALLDENRICMGVSELREELERDDMVALSGGESPIGLLYEEGNFRETEKVPEEVSGEELFKAQMLLLTAETLNRQAEMDAVLAAILLLLGTAKTED